MKNFASLLPLLGPLAFALACNTPPREPPRDGAEVPVGSVSSPATATATATAASATASTSPSTSPSTSGGAKPAVSGKPGACASDADCRTFSSYCAEAPCACRVLPKTDGDPKCLGSGPKVSCFVDPCRNKAARCQSGVCALTAGGSAAATEK